MEKVSIFVKGWTWLKECLAKALAKIEKIGKQTKKIAKDDPRRLIHSLKVGLALTLVSLFYYFQPLYSNFGVSAMWAVMTVVVVFEFSVGATLGKGLNRGLATFAAGALGLGAHHLASVAGKTCEPILIGLFVFLQAVASTFIRFVPMVKARYDYGMLIFNLTFCLVSISGIRTDEIIELARTRLLTILIGVSTCVVVSIFVCPVWAGEDLHKLVANNIDKLGNFLQGFGDECLKTFEDLENGSKSCVIGLSSVLDSKTSAETLANFARWEPGHGDFMYRHPWKQYLKIASLTRNGACRVEALNAYLINSKTQTPQEIGGIISSMSSESGKALKVLSYAIKTMTKPCSPNPHITNLKIASNNLNSLLKSCFCEEHASNLLQLVPVAAVASLLNDTVSHIETIASAVDELSFLANFKSSGQDNKVLKQVVVEDQISRVLVVIDGPKIVKHEGQTSIDHNL